MPQHCSQTGGEGTHARGTESYRESYGTPPSQMPRADAKGHLHTACLCKGHGETLSSGLLRSDWKQRLRGTETAFSDLSDWHITITLQKQMDCSKNCAFPGDFKEASTKQQINSEIERKKPTVNKLSKFHQICNWRHKRSWGRQLNFYYNLKLKLPLLLWKICFRQWFLGAHW